MDRPGPDLVQRNDLLFLALITAVAAIATAPPLPGPSGRWIVADSAPGEPSPPAFDLSLMVSMAPIP